MIELILSGGQTGADRGGLEAAISLGIPHGGWCPAGRRAQDGKIPARYKLQETNSPGYTTRTRKNVQDSDATIVFAPPVLTRGSELTMELCSTLNKPMFLVVLERVFPTKERQATAQLIKGWLGSVCPRVLNVAGSREDPEDPYIQDLACRILEEALRV